MKWFHELRNCDLGVFAGVAVDAYRKLHAEGRISKPTEFLYEISVLLSKRLSGREDSASIRFEILLAVSFELGNGRADYVNAMVGPVVEELVISDKWNESMVDRLAEFGFSRPTHDVAKQTVGESMPEDTVERVEWITPIQAESSSGRVVILTALDDEFDAVRALHGIEDDPESTLPGLRTASRHPSKDIVIVCAGGQGNVRAALAAQKAIDKWSPGLVLLAGTTGGFRSEYHDIRILDILVPHVVVGYDQAKITPEGKQYRLKVAEVGVNSYSIAEDAARDQHWIMRSSYATALGERMPIVQFEGATLSGEKVVADDAEVARLHALWENLLGTEMEGIGMIMAAYTHETRPEALLVKSICDMADVAKDDLYHKSAESLSAAFAYEIADRWVTKYQKVAKKTTTYTDVLNIPDKNGFWDSVNDVEAIRLANILHIRQSEVSTFKQGLSLGVLDWCERHHKVGDLITAVLQEDRLDLLQYLVTPED